MLKLFTNDIPVKTYIASIVRLLDIRSSLIGQKRHLFFNFFLGGGVV